MKYKQNTCQNHFLHGPRPEIPLYVGFVYLLNPRLPVPAPSVKNNK
ncbi:hypothetical protein HMPREF0239_02665 [Clostridium sp. ATCC BAA-442]|nr:hypothetical protein HMPREF0239_02665 [Clostridium sp. ATCC BAA-442]